MEIDLAIIYLPQHLRVGINLPTLYPAPILGDSGEPPSEETIRGISACKVYPRIMFPLQAVSSYLTFSPLSVDQLREVFLSLPKDGYFLWHCLFPPKRDPRCSRGALLYAVRTFLLNRLRNEPIAWYVAKQR